MRQMKANYLKKRWHKDGVLAARDEPVPEVSVVNAYASMVFVFPGARHNTDVKTLRLIFANGAM